LSGKLLELAKEAVPKASRVAVLAYSASPNWKLYFKQMDGTARSLGVQILAFQIGRPDELESAFDTARTKRADALIIPSSGFLSLYRKRIIGLATQNRLPAIVIIPNSSHLPHIERSLACSKVILDFTQGA
jgi:putative tryptophan/tyrosine transport system substrate-binding protein